MSANDYLIETRLKELSPELHQQVIDTIVTLPRILSLYKNNFPEYTDHTDLHVLTVINYCNLLIGENVQCLNADELYVLLMSCYLHDVGMGVRPEEFKRYCEKIDFGDYFDTHDREDVSGTIREFHSELSGYFVEKHLVQLLDAPSEAHVYAIAQTCRGHRRTDLFDEEEFPQSIQLDNGNSICLPYLAAILRLADEMDVTSDRNPEILYDISLIEDERQVFEHKKHRAIKALDVERDALVLHVETSDQEVKRGVLEVADKLQKTLDYCVEVVHKRTPYEITQRQVILC